MILLVGGVKPRTIPALAAGIAWALALPFAVAELRYVLGLYGEVWTMLTSMALASRFVAADFTAVLASLGLMPSLATIAVIRGVAAVATWMAALWIAFRLPPNSAALGVFTLAAAYMCLFNPRAEGLTYAMMGLPCALAAVAGLQRGGARWLWASAAALLVIVGSNGVTAGILELTRFWFKPALCTLALLLIALAVIRTRNDAANVTQLFDKPA